MLSSVDLGDLGLLVASVDIAFESHRPVGGPVELPAGVTHIGRSSFVLQSSAYHRDRLIARCKNVMEVTDKSTGKPLTMPDAFRGQLSDLRLG